MAECKIKEENLEYTGKDENDAMAELYTNYMARQLKDVAENGDVFMGSGFWKWFIFDRAGVTDMSKNKLVRGISNILYESIGKTGKNWVRSRTMSQVKQYELNRQRTLYYKNWVSSYDAWLKENGVPSSRTNLKLTATGKLADFLNWITPTKATWNGHNASGWLSDLLEANGFDERMQYGGQDRELGERLMNKGVKGIQIR